MQVVPVKPATLRFEGQTGSRLRWTLLGAALGGAVTATVLMPGSPIQRIFQSNPPDTVTITPRETNPTEEADIGAFSATMQELFEQTRQQSLVVTNKTATPSGTLGYPLIIYEADVLIGQAAYKAKLVKKDLGSGAKELGKDLVSFELTNVKGEKLLVTYLGDSGPSLANYHPVFSIEFTPEKGKKVKSPDAHTAQMVYQNMIKNWVDQVDKARGRVVTG